MIEQNSTDPVEILRALAACPAAPLHEAYVAARIVAFCQEFGLPYEIDVYGSLLVRLPTGAPQNPTVVFSAHMDHPALEVISESPLTGRLLGSVRPECFDHHVPVRFFDQGREIAGAIIGRYTEDAGTALQLEADGAVTAGAFGVFDVGPFREDGDLLHLAAADDLAGCASILSALARCASRGVEANAIGLFTRCEETGIAGATLVAREGILPTDAIVVSLEASRELPGAVMGDGPVIRVGDRVMTFHPEGEALLRRASDRLLRQQPAATVQRQLMYGGICEATAYLAAGYKATGIAFPLGNYHNVTEDLRIAAEYIHRRDLETGTDLLVTAIEMSVEEPEPEPIVLRMRHRADEVEERLRRTAGAWRDCRLPPP